MRPCLRNLLISTLCLWLYAAPDSTHAQCPAETALDLNAATVEQLVKIMEEFHILRLPIVKDEKLVGVVSRSDILRGLIEPEFMTHL